MRLSVFRGKDQPANPPVRRGEIELVSKGMTKTGESYCMSCGAVVDRDSDKCESCYSELDSEVKAFNCPRCKTVMELGTAQCTKCAMRFIVKSVKEKDPAEDDKLLAKLMDWGKKSVSETGEDAELVLMAEEEPNETTGLSEDEVSSIGRIGDALETFISEREATLSRMRNRIDQVRVNISAFTSSSASGSEIGPDDFEGALSALSKDLADISSLERRIRGLFADVDRIIQFPGIVSILDGRDMRPFLESMVAESGEGSVVDLAERETQVAKREEMVNRKIKAYALKMKQLEARETELSSGASTEPAAEAQAGGVVSREDREGLVRAISGLCEMVDMNVHLDGVDDLSAVIQDASNRISAVLGEKREMDGRLSDMSGAEEEVRRLLKVLDNLLGQLSSEVIDKFSKSEDFALYERVLDRMKI